jgi:hypothetical protein
MTRRIRRALGALALVTLAGGATYASASSSGDPACLEQCALEYQRCQDWGFVEWFCEFHYGLCGDDCRNP